MSKQYQLFRWHTSDKNPTVITTDTLKNCREQMKVDVKYHLTNGGLKKAGAGFQNDDNHATLVGEYDGTWGIQFWIMVVPDTRYSIQYAGPTAWAELFVNLTEKKTVEILKQMNERVMDDLRIEGTDGVYMMADQWLHGRD